MMPRHNDAKSSAAADRHDFGANGNRPVGNRSAHELIADAAAARTTLTDPLPETPAAHEHHQAKKPRPHAKRHRTTEADQKALAAEILPTIGELEGARDDHSKKIASQEADHRAEDAAREAGGEK